MVQLGVDVCLHEDRVLAHVTLGQEMLLLKVVGTSIVRDDDVSGHNMKQLIVSSSSSLSHLGHAQPLGEAGLRHAALGQGPLTGALTDLLAQLTLPPAPPVPQPPERK